MAAFPSAIRGSGYKKNIRFPNPGTPFGKTTHGKYLNNFMKIKIHPEGMASFGTTAAINIS
jgi:hypothetical protein